MAAEGVEQLETYFGRYLSQLFYSLLASEFFIPLRLLGSFFHIAMNGMAASDNIFALLDLPEPDENGTELEEKEIAIRMESSIAIILSHLSCWLLSGIRYLRHFENSARQSWKDGIREI